MSGHVLAAADPWYTSVTAWTIIAAIATVLGTVAAWVGLILGTPRRRLLVGIRAAAPIMDAPEELRSDLQIFDRGTELTEPRFLEIELVGRGRGDISPERFGGQPIQLTVGGRIIRVLTVTTNEPTRHLPKVSVGDDRMGLDIEPETIGRRQHIIIPLLTDGPEPVLGYQHSLSDVVVREAKGDELFRSRGSRVLRVATTVSVGAVVGLGLFLATPSGRQDAFGVNEPIELSPLCVNAGGIVAPPAEINAAFQYRCRSGHVITRAQIGQRCTTQWGPTAQLVLEDRNSAAGWTCHVPGWWS
jgi:hypothetical protein